MFAFPGPRFAPVLRLSLLATLVGCASFAAASTPVHDAAQFNSTIAPLIQKYCGECHGGEKPKGNFRVADLSTDFADAEHARRWNDVLEQLQSSAMPPDGKPRPTEAEVKTICDWIASQAAAAVAASRSTDGRVVLRRLNRVEYENTINDLLGIKANLRAQLPQDGSADGFDNAGAALHTSSFLMERYLEAADTALNMAISNRPTAVPLFQKRFTLDDCRQVKIASENVFRHLDNAVVCFCSSLWQSVGLTGFYPQDGGYYRFRISAYGYQSQGKPVTYRVTAGGGALSGKSGLVGYFDAPADVPTVTEFVHYIEPKTTITLLPYDLPSAQAVKAIGADTYTGPGLAVEWIEVEGPLGSESPTESHRRIFGDLPRKSAPIYNFSTRVEVASDEPKADAEKILRQFTRRAFRRQVTDADIQPFVDVAVARLADGYTFEQAMRAALKGVLLAPEFLFLREVPGKLDDDALASRLSYFLWSTMPDDELLNLAAEKKLHEPDVLRKQVERLLAHPKAANFTENFVGQWLNLREIDFTEPSHILYPDYDHMLKVSMIREVELFFTQLLQEDLSLTNLIASDFTMLNNRLARHYGIPDVDGWEFHKVTLPPGTHRGGVLTMAAVMKVTANGTTTSPVIRGAFVLDKILGTPPSPPPDDVPGLDPDIRGATTIREQLAKHRSVPACASCHVKIDPPGFALESFDVIGGWRDFYRTSGGKRAVVNGKEMRWSNGKPVDPSDVLPDGRKFANIDEFKQLLVEDKDQIARALTTKLLTYATGAAPTAADRIEVDAVVARISKQNYGLRSLVHEIVQSPLFLNK
jgi:cytochrome c553